MKRSPLRRRSDSIPLKNWEHYERNCRWRNGLISNPSREHRAADDWLIGRLGVRKFKVWFWGGFWRDGEGNQTSLSNWAERVPIPNKHKAIASIDRESGTSYASNLERDYHGVLRLRERAGEITDLAFQPVVKLLSDPDLNWRLDFSYTEAGRTIWVDTKGGSTAGLEAFRLKCKLWQHFGPGRLEIVSRVRGQWIAKPVFPKLNTTEER